ncbi:hypothetical protein IEQ34_011642 [Dendrobium chrysotoxum]|uniref:Uncharacterized protein n=1 Tax=Dendrobium chrysotoxum TaxID=161865 RepID=A0AAV7GSS8_DENCH|nr:hypothetical protein IEQ34_011642 [Dendrobium chrysotoxum]
MAGKLLFSVDRDIQVEDLIHSSAIQFGMGFKTLKLSVNGGTIINLTAEGKNGPVVEIAVGATSDLPPMLELVAGATLTPFASSIQSEDKKTEVKSTVEKGSSSSGALFGTKSARKNYLRRIRKKITKSRKIAEQKALSLVEPEAVEELHIPAFSPLLKGSRFHPLAATAGEERVTRIASSPPSPVDYTVKKTTKEKNTLRIRMLRNIIHTCAAETGQTKEQYVRHLKGVISHKLEKEVLKEEKSEARNLTPQPVRRNKKFIMQPVASVLVDGYHWVPRLPTAKIEEIILTGAGRSHPLSGRPPVPPSRLLKLAPVIAKSKEIIKDLQSIDVKGKRPIPLDEPYVSMKISRTVGIQIRDAPIQLPVKIPRLLIQGCEDSPKINVGVPTSQTPSSPVKLDIPHPVEDVTLATTDPGIVGGEGIELEDDQKMLDQLVAEPTTDDLKIQEVLTKLGDEEFEEMINYKGYLPINIESIKGRQIDEVVQEIRDILKKKAIKAFNPEADDLMEEDSAGNICMVEIRASNKDAEPSRHQSGKEKASVAVDSD